MQKLLRQVKRHRSIAICEVLHEDGSPARLPYLSEFAGEHRIAMVSVDQIVEHRLTLDDTDAYGMRTPLLL